MEQRLIDANAYAAELWKLRENYQMLDDTHTADKIMHGIFRAEQALKEQPTVDAVPVVRCEKCSHGIKNHGISDGWVLCTKPYVTDTVGAMMHPNDWFCADGERRDDEQIH